MFGNVFGPDFGTRREVPAAGGLGEGEEKARCEERAREREIERDVKRRSGSGRR